MTLWKLEKIGELRFGLPELCNASSATRADESFAKKAKEFLETFWRALLRLASSTQGRALLRLENKKDDELCCAFLFYMRKENRASIAAPEALTNYKKLDHPIWLPHTLRDDGEPQATNEIAWRDVLEVLLLEVFRVDGVAWPGCLLHERKECHMHAQSRATQAESAWPALLRHEAADV